MQKLKFWIKRASPNDVHQEDVQIQWQVGPLGIRFSSVTIDQQVSIVVAEVAKFCDALVKPGMRLVIVNGVAISHRSLENVKARIALASKPVYLQFCKMIKSTNGVRASNALHVDEDEDFSPTDPYNVFWYKGERLGFRFKRISCKNVNRNIVNQFNSIVEGHSGKSTELSHVAIGDTLLSINGIVVDQTATIDSVSTLIANSINSVRFQLSSSNTSTFGGNRFKKSFIEHCFLPEVHINIIRLLHVPYPYNSPTTVGNKLAMFLK